MVSMPKKNSDSTLILNTIAIVLLKPAGVISEENFNKLNYPRDDKQVKPLLSLASISDSQM
jgi:hypothetical protein